MRALVLILLALTLTGCATGASAPRVDEVKFDRGAFALSYADFTAAIRAKCGKDALTSECVKFDTLDQQVRQAIIDAPRAAAAAAPAPNPLDQLLPLIMKLAPLALGL